MTRTVSDLVPKEHLLRAMRALIAEALEGMDVLFDDIYAEIGKAAVAPERLIRASLLQTVYSIRSERKLVEQIQQNTPLRWFAGPEMDDRVWHHSTLNKTANGFGHLSGSSRESSLMLQHPHVRSCPSTHRHDRRRIAPGQSRRRILARKEHADPLRIGAGRMRQTIDNLCVTQHATLHQLTQGLRYLRSEGYPRRVCRQHRFLGQIAVKLPAQRRLREHCERPAEARDTRC